MSHLHQHICTDSMTRVLRRVSVSLTMCPSRQDEFVKVIPMHIYHLHTKTDRFRRPLIPGGWGRSIASGFIPGPMDWPCGSEYAGRMGFLWRGLSYSNLIPLGYSNLHCNRLALLTRMQSWMVEQELVLRSA